jgi:hypothetical protein
MGFSASQIFPDGVIKKLKSQIGNGGGLGDVESILGGTSWVPLVTISAYSTLSRFRHLILKKGERVRTGLVREQLGLNQHEVGHVMYALFFLLWASFSIIHTP